MNRNSIIKQPISYKFFLQFVDGFFPQFVNGLLDGPFISFGSRVSLTESKSLHSWRIMVRLIPVKWSKKRIQICICLLLGVCYAGQKKRRLTNSSFIAALLENCGLVWYMTIGFSWVWLAHCKDIKAYEPKAFGKNKMTRVMWNNVVLAIMWLIWLERNYRIFVAKKRLLEILWEKLTFSFFRVLNWRTAFKDSFSVIILSWRDALGFFLCIIIVIHFCSDQLLLLCSFVSCNENFIYKKNYLRYRTMKI